MSNESRNLYVAQQFADRSIRPVGRLTLNAASDTPRFEFVYVQSATSIDGFRPYVSFPDFSQKYVSDDLFPFFENRVMARGRPEYEASLASLDAQLSALQRAEASLGEQISRSAGITGNGNVIGLCHRAVRGARRAHGAARARSHGAGADC